MFELTPFNRKNNYIPSLFDEFEKGFFNNFASGLSTIKTDILDKGDHYLLQAELAGFNKEDIHIDVDDDRLTISAEHKEETEDKNDNYIRQERSYGSFVRSFDVSNIKTNMIDASYKNGILELKLPKKAEEAKTAKQIEIRGE